MFGLILSYVYDYYCIEPNPNSSHGSLLLHLTLDSDAYLPFITRKLMKSAKRATELDKEKS